MIEAQILFNERKQEIEVYCNFLNIILEKNTNIISEGDFISPSSDLQRILKANIFILLYNLVESCICQAIEDIYIDIEKHSISYDILKLEIKKEVIKALKHNISADEFVKKANMIAMDIVSKSIDTKKFFSGNLDAKEIKRIAGIYGFSTETNIEKTRNGEKLLTVKSNRNSLAHGDKSFTECGRDYTINDLIEIKIQILHYIEDILQNINSYIQSQKYLTEISF